MPLNPTQHTGINPDRRRWIALIVLSLALFMASMDNTILNVALPTLGRELGATTDELQWTVDAYQVTYAGFLLVAGGLVDRWGRTRTFVAGVAVFGLCSLAAGLSTNTTMLILARGLTGIGAALLTPSTLALISVLFRRPGERTTAFAIWSGANSAGAAVGPLLSGGLLAHFSWGSIFLINVPVAALCLVGAVFLLPRVRAERDEDHIDWPGTGLSIAGLCAVCWAVISAPGLGLFSAPIIFAFLGGIALLVGFVRWQHHASAPLLRLSLFRSRPFAVSVAVSGLVTAGGAGALFVLTQFLQFVLQFTPWQSGLSIMPVAAMMLVGAILAPISLKRIGIKRAVIAGLICVALGFTLLSLTHVGMTYLQMLPGAMFFGLGAGLLMPAATQAVMDSLPSESEGAGSATNSALMQVGSAMGVAITGSLLAWRYREVMSADAAVRGLGEPLHSDILASVGRAFDLSSGGAHPDILAALKRGFVSGMQVGLGASAAVVVLATIAVAIFFPRHPVAPDEAKIEASEPKTSPAP
ncbi:MFS transporter [Propionibacterium freudenreichii]|uniref:MFS transporter n=1 Tax=Propionibacterium freudenreichii TaxID=1744 RepID=UPI000BC31A03|nr:MFS transporter [Propionibacterium freudenreichii]MDK9593107.1 MFS transporter [Propionibacterium freudenreichii]WFF34111.1 MFS transporter [Propionibacterium freudenreichii]WFF36342.1 MFS transporter [Propionibacterium freudenreichii]SBN51796.1 Antiseptic resistance protein [Propionibacterium freudenreichii]